MNREQVQTKLTQIRSAANAGDKARLSREMLKELVEGIYQHLNIKLPKKATLLELIDNSVVVDFINDSDVIQAMHYVRILGMNAEHAVRIRKAEAQLAVENISAIIEETASGSALVHDMAQNLLNSVEKLNTTAEALDNNMDGLKTEIAVFKI
mgnify:CR=1 FL=1